MGSVEKRHDILKPFMIGHSIGMRLGREEVQKELAEAQAAQRAAEAKLAQVAGIVKDVTPAKGNENSRGGRSGYSRFAEPAPQQDFSRQFASLQAAVIAEITKRNAAEGQADQPLPTAEILSVLQEHGGQLTDMRQLLEELRTRTNEPTIVVQRERVEIPMRAAEVITLDAQAMQQPGQLELSDALISQVITIAQQVLLTQNSAPAAAPDTSVTIMNRMRPPLGNV